MARGRPKKVTRKVTIASDKVTDINDDIKAVRKAGYFVVDDKMKTLIRCLDKKTKVYEGADTREVHLYDLVRYGVHGMTLGEIKKKANL